MSLAGLKKQINKANQYVSERVGTAEATKLDEEYLELEKKIDVTNELVEDLMTKTREYLQPNPATRAKMSTVNTISKIRGTNKSMPYPQPEGLLGESMTKYGRLLSEDSIFGQYEVLGRALCDAGEAFRNMADVKYALEDNVKQNFLDPLFQLQQKDLKECNFHRKKLQGRRLDYDCKKRRQPTNEELRQAEEKLEESKRLAESAMFTVLSNDVEQISQLCALVSAQLDFHRQTADILQGLQETLRQRVDEASKRPQQQHIPKAVLLEKSPRSKSPFSDGDGAFSATSHNSQQWAPPQSAAAAPASAQDPWDTHPPAYNSVATNGKPSGFGSGGGHGNAASVKPNKPCARALYDFEPENEGELGFKEGQIINLTSKIDDNWFEGCLPNGNAGFFPVTYVEVVVPLK